MRWWHNFILWLKRKFRSSGETTQPTTSESNHETNNHSNSTKPHVYVELRDKVGIRGACNAAKKHNPKHIIECHFNSYNGSAAGYLVLSNEYSKDFAREFLHHMHSYFPGRKDRGVDTSPERGGNNIKYCSGKHKNILIEPFFGDNPADCITIEQMTDILTTFVLKIDGPVVLIPGHTKASPGANSRHLRTHEYDYWVTVCNNVKNKINKRQTSSTSSETTSTSLTDCDQLVSKKGWHPEYDSFIKEELKTDRYTALLSYENDPNYWVAFFHAMAKAESNCSPTDQYWERKLGNPPGYDPVTNMKYMSEGLLQLSYSDAIYYKCDFDIEGDRNKSSNDLSKTIFKPCRNLKCGLIILNKLVEKHGTPIFNNGHYWAVLKPRNKRHQVFLKYFNQYYS